MNKTILHLAESAYGGGAESVFRDTVHALKAYDLSNEHLVACKLHPLSDIIPDLSFLSNRTGSTRLALSQIYSQNNYKSLKQFLLAKRPDIIHLQNYGNLSPSILRAIYHYKKRFNKVQVIQTVHTFEFICSHYAAYDYNLKRKCTDCSGSSYKFKIFYRRCSRGGFIHSVGKGIASLLSNFYIKKGIINRWITPSEFLKHEMSASGISADQISAIKNPLPVIFTHKSKVNEGFKDRKNTIVYFGRLSEEKNIDLLIKAFKPIYQLDQNTRLKIVGDGLEMQRLRELTRSLDLTLGVEFIPFVSQTVLMDILSKVKVSVLPSKCFETASMLVLESVASNVIPVVANHGGMKEMAEWLNVGLVFKGGEVTDLTSKISIAIRDYEQMTTRFPAGKIKIKDLSLKNYAQCMLNEYKKF